MFNELFLEDVLILKVKNKDILLVLDNALYTYGGSLNWISGYDNVGDILSDGHMILDLIDGTRHRLTRSSLVDGIKRVLPYIKYSITNKGLDLKCIDIDISDFIMQLAVLGDVVYE